MEKNTDYLKKSTVSQLYAYQISSLNRTITDYLRLNKEAENIVWKVCPKCGAAVDSFEKGGFTGNKKRNHRKPMLKCPVCGHRFVEDHGQLTFYSHMDRSIWDKVLADTMEGKSLQATAAAVDKTTVTVFYMRHKILSFLEEENDAVSVEKVAEADEKYVHESHKGLVKAVIDNRTKVIKVRKSPRKKKIRGLGNDKACITTAVQREGGAYIHTANMGKPSSDDMECLDNHIRDGTLVFTDGCTAYEKVLHRKNCIVKELKSSVSYDAVDHLNTVNSLHSKIDLWIRKYRNVNTIYANRYNALFSVRHHFAGEDIEEIVVKILKRLRNETQYFYHRDLYKKTFNDEAVMKAREGLTGIVHINWLKSTQNYRVIYV